MKKLYAGAVVATMMAGSLTVLNADALDPIVLSGTLANGQFLANRAALIDVPLGRGHVVMFAIRPFWRWQTQGTYSLGFNALMNWNDLDAGKADSRTTTTQQPQ